MGSAVSSLETWGFLLLLLGLLPVAIGEVSPGGEKGKRGLAVIIGGVILVMLGLYLMTHKFG